MTQGTSTWQYDKWSEEVFRTPEQFPFRIRLLKWLGRLNWLPRGHDALLRATFDPEGGEHFLFETDFYGLRYRGDLGHYLDWLVFCYGGAPVCELHLLRDVVAHLRTRNEKISFYDVGANIGHHSLFMSPLVDDVFAFEPLEDLVALIRDKINLNGLRNLRVFPVALGEQNGRVRYFPGLGANSGIGSLVEGFPGASRESVPVDIRKGDELFDEEGLPRMDILKLDVQGYESDVLRGLAVRIERDRPVVLAELSDESRARFGDVEAFRRAFYEGALFCEVFARNGRTYQLRPFRYESSEEVLILPPESSGFLSGKL